MRNGEKFDSETMKTKLLFMVAQVRGSILVLVYACGGVGAQVVRHANSPLRFVSSVDLDERVRCVFPRHPPSPPPSVHIYGGHAAAHQAHVRLLPRKHRLPAVLAAGGLLAGQRVLH